MGAGLMEIIQYRIAEKVLNLPQVDWDARYASCHLPLESVFIDIIDHQDASQRTNTS